MSYFNESHLHYWSQLQEWPSQIYICIMQAKGHITIAVVGGVGVVIRVVEEAGGGGGGEGEGEGEGK